MTKTKEVLINKNERVPIASSEKKQLIKIQGTLTSQIQLRGEDCKEPYYYAFIRLKGQTIDLPVIFKLKENDKPVKPSLKKSDQIELTGHYSNSPHSIRKSFTATAYQLFNHKKVRKKPHDYLNQPEENIFAPHD